MFCHRAQHRCKDSAALLANALFGAAVSQASLPTSVEERSKVRSMSSPRTNVALGALLTCCPRRPFHLIDALSARSVSPSAAVRQHIELQARKLLQSAGMSVALLVTLVTCNLRNLACRSWSANCALSNLASKGALFDSKFAERTLETMEAPSLWSLPGTACCEASAAL